MGKVEKLEKAVCKNGSDFLQMFTEISVEYMESLKGLGFSEEEQADMIFVGTAAFLAAVCLGSKVSRERGEEVG